MDPDAPPLVKADTLAGQGEQLSSRRAYQQAHGAHTEAAKQYQLAAQATGDTSAAKALLLQRDKQLKLANEVQRKLERGRSKPAATPTTTTTTTIEHDSPASAIAPVPAPPTRAYGNLSSPYSQPASSNHGLAYRRNTGGLPITTMTGLQQYNHPAAAGRSVGTGAFIPRDRLDASTTMADSRYSRKSNSPSQSQSQISTSVPHSGGESVKTSSVEESYYLMNTDNDPADPVTTFLTVVENMVEELGNAVAFASAPLHIGPPLPNHSGSSALSHTRQASDDSPKTESSPSTKQAGHSNQVLESFYVVPSVHRPGKVARESNNLSNESPTQDSGNRRSNSAQNKTHEELVTENVTLKETLDQLSKRLDWITKERLKEKESLKDSVTIFARDLKKQAERLGQSTVNLNDNRRQMPPPILPNAVPAFLNGGNSNSPAEEMQRKIVSLQDELKLSRLEMEKQSANAQRYKARYDDLRKAILEKRKAKEMAMAAAAAGEAATSSSAAEREDGKAMGSKEQNDSRAIQTYSNDVEKAPTT